MTRNILDSEYNAGFDFGVSSEQERIIELCELWIEEFSLDERPDYVALFSDFINKIKVEPNE